MLDMELAAMISVGSVNASLWLYAPAKTAKPTGSVRFSTRLSTTNGQNRSVVTTNFSLILLVAADASFNAIAFLRYQGNRIKIESL